MLGPGFIVHGPGCRVRDEVQGLRDEGAGLRRCGTPDADGAIWCLVPLSSGHGTYTTVKARFWSGLSGKFSPDLSVVPSSLGSGWCLAISGSEAGS